MAINFLNLTVLILAILVVFIALINCFFIYFIYKTKYSLLKNVLKITILSIIIYVAGVLLISFWRNYTSESFHAFAGKLKLLEYIIFSLLVASFGLIQLGKIIFHDLKILISLISIIFLSILVSLLNLALIVLISNSLNKKISLTLFLISFVSTFFVYFFSRKFVQISLLKVSNNIVKEMRMKLVKLILSSSLQKFEEIDTGQIHSILNNDTEIISDFANTLTVLVTNGLTIVATFIYLASLNSFLTSCIVAAIVFLTIVYYLIVRSVNKELNIVRNLKNNYINLLDELIYGFKELNISQSKQLEFQNHIEKTCEQFKIKNLKTKSKLVNATIIGESFVLMILMLIICISISELIIINKNGAIEFILILLFIRSPIYKVIDSISNILSVNLAFSKITEFKLKLLVENTLPYSCNKKDVEEISFKEVHYSYKQGFELGPITFSAKAGEIIFLTGGNGSGKSTLMKLIIGLYSPDIGEVFVNGKKINTTELKELCSAIHNPNYFFKRFYGINTKLKKKEIETYLQLFQLDKLVTINCNSYSTINLSDGQRKRLNLLQNLLEEKSIFIFDEWPISQEPFFRDQFYNQIITTLKKKNKIVFIVSHDEQYFDKADKILYLFHGKIKHKKNIHISE